MPSTPFHLGPGVFFGLLLFAFVDFPTFLVASVIVDLEPFFAILLGLDYHLHGFLHSFLGGTVVAVVLAFVMSRLSKAAEEVMKLLRLEQKTSWKRTMAASLLGVYSHILLDSPLYPEIRPFYPFDVNPFFLNNTFIAAYVFTFCRVCFLAGFILYVAKLAVQAMKNRK